MTVYAFDVDGTLETSSGPIYLDTLWNLLRSGHWVYIVSPSELRPKGFPTVLIGGGGDRAENLKAVKVLHPDASEFVYVSDNGDMQAAKDAGFEYVRHTDFVQLA
jgi:hypothetical protein